MLRRASFNSLLFAVLLGGIGAFTHVRSGQPPVNDVVVVTVLGGLWAGVIVSLIETRLYPLAGAPRVLGAALGGAAAYVGLFAGVSVLSATGLRPDLLAIGAAIGAVTHGLRAQLYGGSHDDSEDDNDDAGDDSDDKNNTADA
jgi:hypothetical protein